MNTQLAPEYRDMHSPSGSRLIHARIDHHGTHTAVTVVVPFDTTLDRSFTSPAAADAYLAFLETEAASGKTMWQIEQAAGAYTNAAAVFDELADEVLANAKPASLDTYRQQDTRTAGTSEPMDRVLTHADSHGYIRRGKTATSTQLIALKRRGKVELDYRWQGRTRVLFGAWLAGSKPSEVAA